MKRIAILFWGLPRRLDLTNDSIQTHLVSVLREQGYNVCIFQHFYVLRGLYENRRAKEEKTLLTVGQHKLLNPDYFEYDIQEDIAALLKLSRYRTMGNPWSGKGYQTLDNFILASYSKYRVTRMMQDSNSVFDYVLYIRPDVKILCPFPHNELLRLSAPRDSDVCENNKHTSRVLIANFHLFGKFNINDRFAACTWQNYHAFGSHFSRMLRDSSKMKLHSETYIGYIFKKEKIQVIYIDFYFNRIRVDGREENDCAFIH